MSRCSSCGAEITWAMTTAGRSIPIDTKPVPDGNVTLHVPHAGGTPIAVVIPKDQGTLDTGIDEDRYVAHFVSCPDSDQWRKRGW